MMYDAQERSRPGAAASGGSARECAGAATVSQDLLATLLRLWNPQPGERVLVRSGPSSVAAEALTAAVSPGGRVVSWAEPGMAAHGDDLVAPSQFDHVICCRIPGSGLSPALLEWHRVLRWGGHLWLHIMFSGSTAGIATANPDPEAGSFRHVLNLVAAAGFQVREIYAAPDLYGVHAVKDLPQDPASLYAL